MTEVVSHPVEFMTEDQARARRAEIVQETGNDEQALRARAAAYVLDAAELALLDELDGLDYLLNGDV